MLMSLLRIHALATFVRPCTAVALARPCARDIRASLHSKNRLHLFFFYIKVRRNKDGMQCMRRVLDTEVTPDAVMRSTMRSIER